MCCIYSCLYLPSNKIIYNTFDISVIQYDPIMIFATKRKKNDPNRNTSAFVGCFYRAAVHFMCVFQRKTTEQQQ